MVEKNSENKISTAEGTNKAVKHSTGEAVVNSTANPTVDAKDMKIAMLEAQLAAKTSQADLINAIKSIAKPEPTPLPNVDAMNRSSNFKGLINTVDGKNSLEAQHTLHGFRSESKVPISIPKAMASHVGPYLPITVNGVRVTIPCDGKTHYINESHAEHARERLAKLDRQQTKEDDFVEIS